MRWVGGLGVLGIKLTVNSLSSDSPIAPLRNWQQRQYYKIYDIYCFFASDKWLKSKWIIFAFFWQSKSPVVGLSLSE